MRIAILNPSPSSPSRFEAGMRQSLKKTSPVVEPLIPIFGSMRPTSKPGASASTTNAEMPLCPRQGRSSRRRRRASATPAFVMKRLPPFRTYSSPSRRRGRPHRRAVGARARLGQRVGGEPFAARELRQEALLLLVGAGELDPERAELLHGDDQPARRADLRELLDDHEGHQRALADAAVLLVVQDAEEVVLAEDLDDVPRELAGLVDLGRARRDALARERPDELADLALLVVQRVEGAHRQGF